MNPLKIFIVEDETILRVSLADDLKEAGYEVLEFENPLKVIERINKEHVDIVITDVKMPQLSGMELLTKIKEIKPQVTVVVMTAFGSVESAVDAIKKGAYDYITKPFKIDEILLQINRISEMINLQIDNKNLSTQIKSQFTVNSYVGKSEAVKKIHEEIRNISDTSSTVLITGETGTGKELLTGIIHYNSPRNKKPLIKVSCAILSKQIFESELFGHTKGAFTGAISDRIGRFEMADSGTIYLDDIDDIPLDMQVKLLRILEQQEFEKVGSNKTIKIDLRVIASTKKNLKKLVSEGKFREDLYYRLNVFPINLSPIKERKEDIPVLIEHFCNLFLDGKKIQFPDEIMMNLKNYNWPGNVREIKNVVERLTILSRKKVLEISDLPIEIIKPDNLIPNLTDINKPLNEIISKFEKSIIEHTLKNYNNSQQKTAEKLQIPPSTLRSKMLKYKIIDETNKS